MVQSCSQVLSNIIVYFMTFCHLIAGLLRLLSSQTYYQGNPYSDPDFTNVCAVVSICLGALLLVGIIQENYRCFVVYLGITSPLTFLITLQLVIVLTHHAQMVPLVLFIFVILWGIQYFVYVYYKRLVKIDKAKRGCNCHQEQVIICDKKAAEIILEKV